MGSRPIQSHANNFMAKLDKIIKALEGAKAITLLQRFLGDYFFIFIGSTKDLHALFNKMNKCHPTMKFTMNHNYWEWRLVYRCKCEDKSFIPFLDVKCSLQEGKIKTDVYKKETDRNQYLLPSSSHPKQTFKSIQKSLGMRIIRICSDPSDIDTRLKELKASLLAREYPWSVIDSAIEKVKKSRDQTKLNDHS